MRGGRWSSGYEDILIFASALEECTAGFGRIQRLEVTIETDKAIMKYGSSIGWEGGLGGICSKRKVGWLVMD